MNFFRHLPIRHKLTLLFMLVSGVPLLLAGVTSFAYQQVDLRRWLARDLSVLRDMYDDNVASGLAFDDAASIERTLQSLDGNPHILSAAVYSKAGAVIARYQRAALKCPFVFPPAQKTQTHFEKDRLDAFRRIVLDKEQIGTLYIASDLRELTVQARRSVATCGLVLLAALGVAFILSATLRGIISDPIAELAAATATVASKRDYTVRARKQSDDELGELTDAFNGMLSDIQSRDAALRELNSHLEARVQERTRELRLENAERRKAEAILAQRAELSALGAAVAVALTRRESLRDILRECAQSIVDHTGAAFARIWILNSKGDILELQASAGLYTHLDGPHGRVPVGQFKIGLIALEKKPHLTNSVVGDPRVADQEWAKREGMVAFAGYPLIVDERVLGVMALFARQELSDTTLKKLASIADGVALGVVRKQAAEVLRVQEERTRSVVDQAFDAIITTDTEDRIIDWNQQAERTFGWSRCEVTGHSLSETILPARQREVHRAELQRFLAGGQRTLLNRRMELEGMHKDGHAVPIELAMAPIRVGEGYLFNAFVRDITERKKAEADLHAAHQQLVDISRQAGMAEVATSVLHNVGNVLNSVNVSATLVADKVKGTRVSSLTKVAALLNEHTSDLAAFLTSDPKGKQLPGYLHQLAAHLAGEQGTIVAELESLRKNVEHIKLVVAMQQSYSKVSGASEKIKVVDLVEDALRMDEASLERHNVRLQRQYEAADSEIVVEKHKVLQILVNLIRNAKMACEDSYRPDPELILRVSNGDNRIRIAVTDNGVGIAQENLIRIFSHGFTTRKDGHGFGLHNSALAAQEMGGALQVRSAGPGQGATFILELPKAAVVSDQSSVISDQ